MGTHHSISRKNAQRYADEVADVHNAKDLNTRDRIRAMIGGFDGKRLSWRDLTAA